MPITKSAQKALRSSLRKRAFNLARKTAMTDAVKKIKKLILAGKSKEAEATLPEVYKAIDKAAKRGVIKQNAAARKKSRLVLFLRKKSK
jgi:small subunit ribosomal protein S20